MKFGKGDVFITEASNIHTQLGEQQKKTSIPPCHRTTNYPGNDASKVFSYFYSNKSRAMLKFGAIPEPEVIILRRE